jgi:hypothetical protein
MRRTEGAEVPTSGAFCALDGAPWMNQPSPSLTFLTKRLCRRPGSAFAAVGPVVLFALGILGGAPLAACIGAPFEALPAPSAPAGKCDAVEEEHAIEGFAHVAVCSPVTYATLPPCSGDHYPIWAAYKTYATPVPEGFLVHDLEHGAVVLTYNCPNGCAADVAAAQAMLDKLPADPDCAAQGSPVRRRVLMTPDPKLDVPFAASAWGWTLRAKCFDSAIFEAFALHHYNQGRENICANGDDVSVGLAAGCGRPDGG